MRHGKIKISQCFRRLKCCNSRFNTTFLFKNIVILQKIFQKVIQDRFIVDIGMYMYVVSNPENICFCYSKDFNRQFSLQTVTITECVCHRLANLWGGAISFLIFPLIVVILTIKCQSYGEKLYYNNVRKNIDQIVLNILKKSRMLYLLFVYKCINSICY